MIKQLDDRRQLLLSALTSSPRGVRLVGRASAGEPVRIYCADDDRALFVVADVLSALGYQNLNSGVAQHIRRIPVAVEKVRITGRRGYPWASAVDSNGVEWLIDKTRPRFRVWDEEGFYDEDDQSEAVEAFREQWRGCFSQLPAVIPIQYPDLEAMRYTASERQLAQELRDLTPNWGRARTAAGTNPFEVAAACYQMSLIADNFLTADGPWNLQGKHLPIP